MAVMTRELRVQAGTETTWGTSVAGTVILRGVEEFGIQAEPDIRMLDDMSLALAGSAQAAVLSQAASATGRGWASYEQLPYWLDALFGEATPGSAPGYVRTYAAPTTAATAIADMRILTLIHGDTTVGGYALAGGIVNSLTISGEPKEPLGWQVELIGMKAEAKANASLTIPTVTPILGSHVATIKYDAWSGTMGGTALDNCYIRSFELTVTANRTLRHCFGALTAEDYSEMAWDGTLRLSLEFNSTTKTDVSAIIGATLTQKQVELNIASGSLAAQIQFAGTVMEAPELFSDDDGIVTAEVTLTRTYHTTFANWLKMSVTNAVSSLA